MMDVKAESRSLSLLALKTWIGCLIARAASCTSLKRNSKFGLLGFMSTAMTVAWVPFPEPGGPINSRRTGSA